VLVVAGVAVARDMARARAVRHPASLVLLLAIGGLFAWLTWALRANPEESLHFVQYGVLGWLLFRALRFRLADPSIYVAGLMIGAAAGICDELIQWVVPRRFFDFRDIGINILSGVLVQAALAWGVRPDGIAGPWSARGVAISARWLLVMLGMVMFALANNHDLKMRYELVIPLAKKIPEITAEYGFRHEVAGVGSFRSRLNAAEWVRQDRERGAEIAALLDPIRSDVEYYKFLDRTPAHLDPLPVETRIRIFRRDRHAHLYRDGGAEFSANEHARIAWRENELLERHAPGIMSRSRHRWPPETAEEFRRAAAPGEEYESPVSGHLITAFSRRTAVIALAGMMMLVLLVERKASKR